MQRYVTKCNAKVMKKKRQKKIDSNIEEAFKIIDNYLPANYTNEVMEIVPFATAENIRTIKRRKSGDLRIIAALKKVAEKYEMILN